MADPDWLTEWLRLCDEAAKVAPGTWKVEHDLGVECSAPTFITASGRQKDRWGESDHVIDGPFFVQCYESCTITDDESDPAVMGHVAACSPERVRWLLERADSYRGVLRYIRKWYADGADHHCECGECLSCTGRRMLAEREFETEGPPEC